MAALDDETRLQLLRFVCTLAWTDFELHPRERTAINNLADRLDLDDDERDAVARWLRNPPAPDDVDPQEIPIPQRERFIKECKAIVEADGVIRPEERETLNLLEKILGLQPDA